MEEPKKDRVAISTKKNYGRIKKKKKKEESYCILRISSYDTGNTVVAAKKFLKSREWTAKAGVLEKKRLEFLTWRNPQETKSLIMVGKNEPIQTGNKTP